MKAKDICPARKNIVAANRIIHRKMTRILNT